MHFSGTDVYLASTAFWGISPVLQRFKGIPASAKHGVGLALGRKLRERLGLNPSLGLDADLGSSLPVVYASFDPRR